MRSSHLTSVAHVENKLKNEVKLSAIESQTDPLPTSQFFFEQG